MTEEEKGLLQRENMVYQAIASRRLQWDYLEWQVPALGLTAQAFLFTIAVGGGSSQLARIVASALAVIVAFLCVTLMARHREAELLDAEWLEDFERDVWGDDPQHRFRVHGEAFVSKREKVEFDGGWTERFVKPLPGRKTLPGFKTWIFGLLSFGLAGAVVFAISIFDSDVFLSPQRSSDGSAARTAPAWPISTDDPECAWDGWCW